jgi:NAD(P)-dependent dehydrogenase (short-subunit alcohol dehydrogenase family)
MTNDMSGKTVVFSGGTRGMGRLAAIELAKLGADLILIGHDAGRGAEAVAAVREAGSRKAEFIQGDLGKKSEVERVAAKILSLRQRVHVLINNAAAFPGPGERTSEGVDQGYALNFLAPFLLTRLLEGALTAAGGARVINLTSMGHRMVKKMDLDKLMAPGPSVSVMDSYGCAKLAMVTWTYGLARRLESAGVTANILDPHMVETKIGESFPGNPIQRWVMFTAMPALFGVSMEKGALPYVHLAAAPELAATTGAYFVKLKRKDSSPLSHDEVLARRIDEAADAWAKGARVEVGVRQGA